MANNQKEIGAARRKLGAIVEAPSIYQNMSARENLEMQCTILGITDDGRVQKTLERVGLGELYSQKKHASNYSLGMRQRLGIAMALLSDPEFLILDEPMNGLDPAGIVEVRELILQLNREQGITFLISSHILTELELVATKYGIISKGKILREITVSQLHQVCGKFTWIQTDDPAALGAALQQAVPELQLSYTADSVRISGEVDLNKVLQTALDTGLRISAVNCKESSFEDYYLSVIGGTRNG